MEREKITIDKELAVELCQGYDVDPEYFPVSNTITGHKRWSVVHTVIIKRWSDSKYFQIKYYVPATESQEQEPFDGDDAIFTEVFPITRNHTFYE